MIDSLPRELDALSSISSTTKTPKAKQTKTSIVEIMNWFYENTTATLPRVRLPLLFL
jgi:hypothetical protein